MKINKIIAAYFSATGTTKKTVTVIAERVGELLSPKPSIETVDFSLPQAREKVYGFKEDELLICGIPTYAGRVPNLLLPFVSQGLEGSSTPLVSIATFGNRNYDDSLMELTTVLAEKGFVPVAGGAFSCEHAFSVTLGAGRPDAEDLAEMCSFAEGIAEKLGRFEKASELPKLTVGGEFPIRPYFTPRDRNGNAINILKVTPKTKDSCIACGLCAKVCTMGSIDREDFKKMTGKCIKCCACVKRCPVGAKYYDDEGYLYHKSELEEMYARRAQNATFL